MMINHIRERISTMFSDLTFDKQRHLYFWDNQRVPKSVSALVEEHEYPFDELKLLRGGLTLIQACARKEGLTEHELRHKWQTINKEACDLGTETHDFLEAFTGLESPSTPQQIAGIKFFKEVIQEYDIVFRELRMYSRKYNFAGTADLLLRHKTTGKFVLADYKTNKDLFKAYDMLRPPFDYLESHPYSKYQLQLCYYQMILEEIGCPISERLLVYLRADETYKIYSTADFTPHLIEYLDNKIAA